MNCRYFVMNDHFLSLTKKSSYRQLDFGEISIEIILYGCENETIKARQKLQLNHLDAINFLMLTKSNTIKQENPMIFRIKETGVKSLKKL